MLIKKAQNTAEYAILIVLVVGAVIAMQTYVKRGWQGRVKDSSRGLVKAISGSSDWTVLDSDAPTPTTKYQYEYDKISAKSTQKINKDEEKYTLKTDGTTTRDTTEKTEREKGDYQEITYPQF